jgi:hypothetical protein
MPLLDLLRPTLMVKEGGNLRWCTFPSGNVAFALSTIHNREDEHLVTVLFRLVAYPSHLDFDYSQLQCFSPGSALFWNHGSVLQDIARCSCGLSPTCIQGPPL